MKTLAPGLGLLALAVSTGTSGLRATPLPQPPAFSDAPLEVPSLELKDTPAKRPFPDLPPTVFQGLPKRRTTSSESPIDRMPIGVPRDDIDYKLIVKTPNPTVDYKLLLREVPPPPAVK